MKSFIYVLSSIFLFSANFSVGHAWTDDTSAEGGSTFCGEKRLMKLKGEVKKCQQLAYQNFLEEKISNVNEFKARCDYLDFQASPLFRIRNLLNLFKNNQTVTIY